MPPPAAANVTGLHDGLSDEQADAFETTFLQPVDSQTRDALKKMVAFQNLSAAERSAFTRLQLSLLFRTPEVIADIKHHMWNAAIDSLRDEISALGRVRR